MSKIGRVVDAVDDDMQIPAEIYEQAIIDEARRILMEQADCAN